MRKKIYGSVLILILIISLGIYKYLAIESNQKLDEKKNQGQQNKIEQTTIYESEKKSSTIYLDSILPVKNYEISSYFGPRLQASKGYTYDFHRGIDFHHGDNVDIYSIADGIVRKKYLESDPQNPYKNSGTTVIIEHSLLQPYIFHGKEFNKIYSYYTHLDEINENIKINTPIKKGELLGTMGSSGTTTYNHLHFEIRVGVMCSREYQRKKPNSNCAKIIPNNGDPHVNPYVFFPKEQIGSYKIKRDENAEHLKFEYISDRSSGFINTIKVEDSQGSKVIDFNHRFGIHPTNRDNNIFNNIKISPAEFSVRSKEYIIEFEFFDVQPDAQINIQDIYGEKTYH